MPTAKILLVEDEPIIALDLRLMLEHQGHRVWLADNPAEALWLCSVHRPDTAILNICYPELADGLALAHRLQAMRPLTVFFVTGTRLKDFAASVPDEPGRFEILRKPFSPSQFRSLFAQSLP
jgi:two-component system, OmpR family, response regulator ResD